MAGRGFSAAPGSRRYVERKQDLVVLKDGVKRGPALPQYTPFRDADGKRVTWHPMTRTWWNNWRTSPQSMQMQTDADWDFHLATAVLHHKFWAEGRVDLAGELRLREGKFGATTEDRARLRLQVADSSTTASSVLGATRGDGADGASDIDEYRARRERIVANDEPGWAEVLAQSAKGGADG